MKETKRQNIINVIMTVNGMWVMKCVIVSRITYKR